MLNQVERLEHNKEELRVIYWELMDNKDFREAKRLDTIIGKIEELQKILER